MAMQRISVFVTPGLRRGLEELQARIGEPQAVLIRRAIREHLRKEGISTTEPRKRKTRR